nr:sugar nucleotide-binding protein [Clostridium estertheticum]
MRPKNLAAAANQIGSETVQVSTDYVFAFKIGWNKEGQYQQGVYLLVMTFF